MIPVRVFAGRDVAVFGLGLSGLAAARALRAGGAEPVCWDDGEAGRARARETGLTVIDLVHVDWHRFAALVLAPGVPLTHPEPHWTVRLARDAGVEVIGDTELFFRERARAASGARVVAITGTNGKSTTTALTAHLLRCAGRTVALGGNIGTAVLDLDPLSDDRTYVIEFSSFQIDLTPTLDANAAALLNITPDHLDRHGTLQDYVAIKARVFASLGEGDTAVVGVDDEHSRAIADRLAGAHEVVRVSAREPLDDGVFVELGTLIEKRRGRRVGTAELTGIGSLRGIHNWQNAAAAYALARSQGLQPDTIAAGLRSFPGLAHRLEEVGRMGRVLFINDSKATNADAAGKALASFQSVYWIAGGLPKAGGIAGLEAFHHRIAKAYLIGQAAEEFARTLDGRVESVICGTLDRAVAAAARDAAASNALESVVLLSPACASYDQFENFVARGDAFRAAVASLEGVTMRERQTA